MVNINVLTICYTRQNIPRLDHACIYSHPQRNLILIKREYIYYAYIYLHVCTYYTELYVGAYHSFKHSILVLQNEKLLKFGVVCTVT